jgi:predicted glycoside hydrolase/deacetylase ChbG (UPF0249 family)
MSTAANASKKYLIVNGDDFGSSEAANRGIIRSMREGILTSASLMAPCAWFPQAAELAKEHNLACAMHMTLTCEYERYHFGPLTRAPELTRDSKGHTFIKNPGDLRVEWTDVIYAELEAQVERFLEFGIHPAFIDAHMCVVPRWDNVFLPVAERLHAKYRIPFLRLSSGNAAGPKDLPIHHISGVGSGPPEQPIKQRFLAQLKALPAGVTYMSCHPAEMSPEMKAMELEDGFAHARQIDLELLIDADVRDVIRGQQITLLSPRDLAKALS